LTFTGVAGCRQVFRRPLRCCIDCISTVPNPDIACTCWSDVQGKSSVYPIVLRTRFCKGQGQDTSHSHRDHCSSRLSHTFSRSSFEFGDCYVSSIYSLALIRENQRRCASCIVRKGSSELTGIRDLLNQPNAEKPRFDVNFILIAFRILCNHFAVVRWQFLSFALLRRYLDPKTSTIQPCALLSCHEYNVHRRSWSTPFGIVFNQGPYIVFFAPVSRLVRHYSFL
jgi:hypothetical protein